MTREEAIKIINCYDIGFYDLSGEKIPADKLADAFDVAIEALKAEPKTGEWVHEGVDYMTGQECWSRLPCFCSECKQETRAYFHNYCPNCGAKMKGEQDD